MWKKKRDKNTVMKPLKESVLIQQRAGTSESQHSQSSVLELCSRRRADNQVRINSMKCGRCMKIIILSKECCDQVMVYGMSLWMQLVYCSTALQLEKHWQ